MASKRPPRPPAQSIDAALWRDILGYLNFSSGSPDAAFQRNLNRVFAAIKRPWSIRKLRGPMLAAVGEVRGSGAEFADVSQAEAALLLVFDALLPAYRAHHGDLLFHLDDEFFLQPFFVARAFEAVLSQGPPWDERERIVAGALEALNDFLGYRPIAVLEDRRRMEPYPHERFQPIPLYLKDAGVAEGRYHDLIVRTIEFFRETPPEILREAHFDLDRLHELAVDVRAHDHTHPANKRTNYMFGEWDPHRIDNRGYYTRFVVRRIILDALASWIERHRRSNRDEVLYDAAAVLSGTMLMASSISGYGPDTHDSSVTLTSLLPRVARQRDAFYARLLNEATGARRERLEREAALTQQPFGHVRQQLNIELSGYGARQVQYRHLAQLYARMGYPEAAQRQAAVIPSASARFESELQWRLTTAGIALGRRQIEQARELLAEVEDLLHRGIECGALVDPWNILGFQAQFPLFTSREDSVPDQRIDVLLDLMEQIFNVYARALSEAAAAGNRGLLEEFSFRFERLADFWDRFATTAVEELPRVSGRETLESARHVAEALSGWRAAGEAAGDISYWRGHVENFTSPKAYAQVVQALLDRGDHVAAMGLLMQWLSEADSVGLEAGPYSLNDLLVEWLRNVTEERMEPGGFDGRWQTIRRLFDYLEANAGVYWSLEDVGELLGPVRAEAQRRAGADADDDFDEALETQGDFFDMDDDEEDLFGAAYDDVVYRDSTMDGVDADTLDDDFAPGTTEFELIARSLEPRLHFVDTLAQLWQTAALTLAAEPPRPPLSKGGSPAPEASSHGAKSSPPLTKGGPGGVASADDTAQRETARREAERRRLQTIDAWRKRTAELQEALVALMDRISNHPIFTPTGDLDANIEYDVQLQTKSYLLHTAVATCVRLCDAERLLRCCLPEPNAAAGSKDKSEELRVVAVYRAILTGDAGQVRRELPALMTSLRRKGLLYVPCNQGGAPEPMLDARLRLSVIRFLLVQLPRLGLLREAYRVLEAAYKAERATHPGGQAVTEFDQLFRAALESAVECVVRSSTSWRLTIPRRRTTRRTQRSADRRTVPSTVWAGRRRSAVSRRARGRLRRRRNTALIELLVEVVERYRGLWLKHSRTMRLSTVEALKQKDLWDGIVQFTRAYGAELFQAGMLTLGNLRTILHNGVDEFLEYLDETRDPVAPLPLLDDIDADAIEFDTAVEYLELIYGSVVDRIDRFVEYNTTTTQSDYGEMFYTFLDFMRVEATYERDAWNFAPYELAHQALAQRGKTDAALAWERFFAETTAGRSRQHLAELAQLERKHAMRLPSVTDRLNERFVKPLAVNRMLALVPRVMEDARRGRHSQAFAVLQSEVDAYLAGTSGSAIDVAPWLRALEKEVERQEDRWTSEQEPRDPQLRRAPVALSLRKLRRQLQLLETPPPKPQP
ncbi:MAG: hypothetical protein KY476_08955 [Planctomycetes bacterium]|nr:hypothetical protein [Planctomycetota bacterium]